MITKEKTKEFIDRAYKCACEHGFHDEEKSVSHWMMLVASEIGEMVEADRAGRYHFVKNLRPKMSTKEEWRPTRFSKDYEVSNFGRVRSKDMEVWNGQSYHTKKGRILKAGLGGNGYYTVCLRGKTYKVAVLVADAFLEKKNPSDIVNHIDGNKKNDNVGNLEWVSSSDNNLHAIKTGLRRNYKRKLSYEDCVYIAFQRKRGRAYTSILKDRDFGVTKSAIQRICKEYKKYTDSVEFELADVCIRLYDFCGVSGIEPEDFSRYLNGDSVYTWSEEFGDMSVCEQCYELVQYICEISGDSSADEISETVGAALLYCFCFAQHHGIDIERHIVLKMDYNESREVRHGKQY